MNRFPRILIDTGKVIANFQRITERARRAGIDITGVLKGLAGDVNITAGLIEVGLTWIGDSWLENLKKIKAPVPVRKMLLLQPAFRRLEQPNASFPAVTSRSSRQIAGFYFAAN